MERQRGNERRAATTRKGHGSEGTSSHRNQTGHLGEHHENHGHDDGDGCTTPSHGRQEHDLEDAHVNLASSGLGHDSIDSHDHSGVFQSSGDHSEHGGGHNGRASGHNIWLEIFVVIFIVISTAGQLYRCGRYTRPLSYKTCTFTAPH